MNVKVLNVKIDEFVSYTMSFLNNIQVFHWQTQSYAEHEALGEYYESLTDLNDKLVESWQGNQNTRLKFSEGPYSLENYFSKEETKNRINEFKNKVTQLSGFVAELNESNSFDDIENILEEISEVNGLVFGISTTAVTPPQAADSEPVFQSSLCGYPGSLK